MTYFDRTYFDSENIRGQLVPPIWPLPSLAGRAPIIAAIGARQPYVQLDYPDGTTVPSLVPVLCVGNGEILYCGPAGIIVDHKNGFSTYYCHLDHKFACDRRSASRKKRERVNVGDILGYVTLPFQFEVWHHRGTRDHSDFGPLDPAEHLKQWAVIPFETGTASNDNRQPPLAA